MIVAQNLGKNIQNLRKKRGFSQLQLAQVAEMTRASVALLESGTSNPTLENLMKVCNGLKVTIDELLSKPRAECQLIRAEEVPVDRRSKRGIILRKLLPDKIPMTEIDELHLEQDAVLTGTPHIEGTREYFTCVHGSIAVAVLGEIYQLHKGDVLAFPGDKPHSYKNTGKARAQGISVVLFSMNVSN